MSESLKSKTVKGVIWSSIERFSIQGIQFIIMIIMARLLSPKDYGIIGMIAIFLAISQSLIDSGFSQALIRKQNRTETDNSTVFYFNIIVSSILYIILFVLAPLVANFYNQPELTIIMRIVCISIIINSLAVVQRALLTIKVDFKTQAKASVTAVLISGAIGITLAYKGLGVWSLVIQQLINLSTNTLLLWTLSKWRPKLVFSWLSFNELFAFGSKLLASGLLDSLYRNIYPIVIGKLFNATSLGYYTRAHHFAEFPSSNITGILQRVTYPILCSIQNETYKLESIYRKFLRLSAFIIFPLMIGLSAISRPFINLILGPQWDFCGKLLQIICFAMMWYPIHAINLNLLQVQGRSDLFLRLEIIKKLLGITVICISFPFGLIVMCYGQVLNSIIALVINTYYTGKLINIGFFKQMKDLAPTIMLSFIMFSSILFINMYINSNELKIIIGFISGAIIYISGSYILRFNELNELFSIIKRKKN